MTDDRAEEIARRMADGCNHATSAVFHAVSAGGVLLRDNACCQCIATEIRRMQMSCPIGCGECGAVLDVRLMVATPQGDVGGSSGVLEPGVVGDLRARIAELERERDDALSYATEVAQGVTHHANCLGPADKTQPPCIRCERDALRERLEAAERVSLSPRRLGGEAPMKNEAKGRICNCGHK